MLNPLIQKDTLESRIHINKITNCAHFCCQQQPPLLLLLEPLSVKTSSHSLIPPRPQVCLLFGRLLRLTPSSPVMPLFTLAPSSAPQVPLSPYWIPLIGSSGSISPNSILVNIILAKRLKTSSTFSPDRAETSTETGMLTVDAHFDASSLETSRPSGATVALSWEPKPILLADGTEPPRLEGVPPGRELSINDPELFARSALFPTSKTVRFGEARARASFMKLGRPANVPWDVISYTNTAPAAPR